MYTDSMNKEWFLVPLFLLFLISVSLNFFFYSHIKNGGNQTKVLYVIDGDTIVLENKTRLRLRQIDAPELNYCGGSEAKALLENLLKDKKITISQPTSDQLGRLMAYVYTNKTLVNLELIKSGWVRYHHDSTLLTSKLKKAAEEAKNSRRGIYSEKCYQTENTNNPKCNIKGNIDKNSGKKTYYYPGCPQYQFTIIEKDIGEDWFCTEKEAEDKGFSKAKNCPK